MVLALCIDDRLGLQFNHRRQSRDGKILEDLFSEACGRVLISRFSEKLFAGAGAFVFDDPLAEAEERDLVFYEGDYPLPEGFAPARVILYRWNRAYPGDLFMDCGLTAGMRLVSSVDFAGSSHEKITKEIYER